MSTKAEARESFLREIGKAMLATVVATASATWTVRSVLSDYDKRITVLETRAESKEKTDSNAIAEMRTDLRELRTSLIGEPSKR